MIYPAPSPTMIMTMILDILSGLMWARHSTTQVYLSNFYEKYMHLLGCTVKMIYYTGGRGKSAN